MENYPLKLKNKVSVELLNVLSKIIMVFRDNNLMEAFNRIEIQVKEYEETKQPCDLTYLRDLCNQFDDKLTQVCKEKTDMAKMTLNPEFIEKLRASTQQEENDKKNTPKAKIGF